MNRTDFMKELRAGIVKLPYQEAEAALEYYEEYFEEAGAENEERVLEELGDPRVIAKQIMEDFHNREAENGNEFTAKESENSYDFSNKGYQTNNDFTSGAGSINLDDIKLQENKESRSSFKSLGSSPLVIILLVIAIPVIVPLLFGAIGVLIGIEVTIFALGIVSFVLSVAGVVCLMAGAATLGGQFMTGLFVIGIALAIFGFALIMGLVTKYANKFVNVFLLGSIKDLITNRSYGRR